MPAKPRPPMPKLPPFALMNEQPPRKVKPLHLVVFFFVFAFPLYFIHLPVLNLPFFWDEMGRFGGAALQLCGSNIVATRCAMLLLAAAALLLTFLLAIELSRGTKGAPAFLPPVFLLITPLFFTQSMMAQTETPVMLLTLTALLLAAKKEHWPAAAALVAALALMLWSTGGATIHPGPVLIAFGRSLFYLFIADMRVAGTAVLLWQAPKLRGFFAAQTGKAALVFVALNIVWTSLQGDAMLERFLLPSLPFFYIAVSIALTHLRKPITIGATAILLFGLGFSIRFNPPYPFPLENNYAMVDFVHLEQQAADYAEHSLRGRAIATAWPYTTAFAQPKFGFVSAPVRTIDTHDFRYASMQALPAERFDALIVYSREPGIPPEQFEQLGLHLANAWSVRGQTVSIYFRSESFLPHAGYP